MQGGTSGAGEGADTRRMPGQSKAGYEAAAAQKRLVAGCREGRPGRERALTPGACQASQKRAMTRSAWREGTIGPCYMLR